MSLLLPFLFRYAPWQVTNDSGAVFYPLFCSPIGCPLLFIFVRNIIRRCISIPNALSFPLFYSFSIPHTIPNSRNAPCSFEGNSHDQLFKCITQREAKPFAIPSLSLSLYTFICMYMQSWFELIWMAFLSESAYVCCLKHWHQCPMKGAPESKGPVQKKKVLRAEKQTDRNVK